MYREAVYFTVTSLLVTVGAQLMFPENFLFGAGTSASQCEGGWNADGRTPSNLDNIPKWVDHDIDGELGSDSYHRWMDDVKIVANMSLNFYRFSISWSRVLPNGDLSEVNEKGVDYYNNIINSLLERKIEPMITMCHFEWPETIQAQGGLENPKFVEYFVAYARFLFRRFGDRVKYWITFNEPYGVCYSSVLFQNFNPGISEYLCGKNVLLSHANVYRMYKKSFYGKWRGQLGITLNSQFYYPKGSGDDAERAVERALQFNVGWFAHPIFSKKGNWPKAMIERIGNNSVIEGLPESRLPTLSQKSIDLIRGSADFFGLNHYSSQLVEDVAGVYDPNSPSFLQDRFVIESADPSWAPFPTNPRFYVVPQGIRDFSKWIKTRYNNPVVMIHENGYSDSGDIKDYDRIKYLRAYLKQLLKAIIIDDCNVVAYSAWSLIDQYEPSDKQYRMRFGLYAVDMVSDGKERTPRLSAEYYKGVATTHSIPSVPTST